MNNSTVKYGAERPYEGSAAAVLGHGQAAALPLYISVE